MHLDPGPLVVLLVLAAAVLHAGWNAIAHAAEDRLVGFALLCSTTFLLGAVLIVVGDPVGWRFFWFAAVSGSLHTSYVVLLMRSYEHADLSRAYPLARGTGVALVGIASLALPRSPLDLGVVLGVGLVVLGILGVTFAGPRLTRVDTRGIGLAVATGVAIAGYTVVDGLAVSDGAPLLAYGGWLIALHSWVVPVYAVAKRGRDFWAIARSQAAWSIGGGVVSLLAYGLVLLAQTSGQLAAVAALRELSIAFGVLLGATVLHEALARKRLLPALVLTAGAVVLALGIA
jgi:drug/metabolite transporter (DMT)-like permease